jgi:hypothetical protein
VKFFWHDLDTVVLKHIDLFGLAKCSIPVASTRKHLYDTENASLLKASVFSLNEYRYRKGTRLLSKKGSFFGCTKNASRFSLGVLFADGLEVY